MSDGKTPYNLTVLRTEDYSGEHREWEATIEIPLDNPTVKEIRADALEEAARLAENYHHWQGSSDLAHAHTKEWLASVIRKRKDI